MIDLRIPPLPDFPRLRDRVKVAGHDGIYIVIACNTALGEVDLAGASKPGYLFGIPVSDIRPVSGFQASRTNHQHRKSYMRMAKL